MRLKDMYPSVASHSAKFNITIQSGYDCLVSLRKLIYYNGRIKYQAFVKHNGKTYCTTAGTQHAALLKMDKKILINNLNIPLQILKPCTK